MPRRVSYTFLAIDKYTAMPERIKQKTRGMRQQFKSLGQDAIAAGEKISKIGSKLRKFSLYSAAAAGASLKAFSDLESGVTNVLTLLDDPQVIEFSGDLQKLAEDAVSMGFGIEDATKALFDNVSALGANQKSFDTFRVAQKLAIGGVTELSIAVDGLTSVVNAYGTEVTDANEVAQAFFVAQKFGKTTVQELAQSVGKVAPIAKTAGVGFQELLATMSQLTLGGIQIEESTTALRGVFSTLLKPSKDAEKVLRAFGVPVGATEVKAAGLVETLRQLTIVSQKYPDYLAQAIPNIRAFTAAAALGEPELQNIEKIIGAINTNVKDGTGYLAAYDRQMGTLGQQTKMTWGSIKLLASMIGEHLAPAMKWIGDIVRSLVVKFSNLKSTTKAIIAWIIGIAAVIGPIVSAIGAVMTVLGYGATFLAAIGAFFISWPFLIAAAIVAAAILIVENFDWIKEKWNAVVKSVKGFFSFGTEEMPEVSGDVTARSQTDINVNLNAPKGMINSVKAKTTGTSPGPNVGVNMATAS